jgi:hypothetical protein
MDVKLIKLKFSSLIELHTSLFLFGHVTPLETVYVDEK